MKPQNWESCMLYLDGAYPRMEAKEGTAVQRWGYACGVNFYSANGDPIHVQISIPVEIPELNPFDVAMGRLGGYGWELVSAQHATYTAAATSGSSEVAGYLSWVRRVAYFKRPAVEGREINDASLKEDFGIKGAG
jgi:hypothetical protein